MATFNSIELPTEIWFNIFSFLDAKTITFLPLVCKEWHNLSKTEFFYKLIYKNTWPLYIKISNVKNLENKSWKVLYNNKLQLDNRWQHPPFLINQFDSISSFTRDGLTCVLSYEEGNIEVINIQTGLTIKTLENQPRSSLLLLHKKDFLIFKIGELIRIINWKTDESIEINQPGLSVSRIEFDGTNFIFLKKNVIYVWNTETSQLTYKLKGHTSTIEVLKIVDHYLLSGSFDYTIKIWNLLTGTCEATLTGHNRPVLQIDANASQIVSVSSDSEIRIWDRKTYQCLYKLKHAGIKSLQIKDKLLLTASENKVKIWGCKKGKHLKTMEINNLNTFKVEEDKLITGSTDGRIDVWDMHAEKVVHTLLDDGYKVDKIEIQDHYLITYDNPVNFPGTVRIWKQFSDPVTIIQSLSHFIHYYCSRFFHFYEEGDGDDFANFILLSIANS
jgi:WD40 repeat protein